MGKASKWIRNFLMGKREDKDKKSGPLIPSETHPPGTPIAMVLQALTAGKIKRRWSFKRSSSTKPTMHKSGRSMDSILVPKQVLLDYETQEHSAMLLLQKAHAAATKIQAAYRSYLARKALRALRGLVKLQALARGHLVRKQMTSVLRSMHAVLAIQVRARIHRVQMAEDSSLLTERKLYRDSPAPETQLRKEIINIGEGDIHKTRESLRSRSARIDHKLAERVEYGSRGFNSGRRSVSQTEYYHKRQICPTPSTLSFTDSSSMTNDGQLDEFSLKMAQGISKLHSLSSQKNQPFTMPLVLCPDHIACNPSFLPNYMTNTKSSNAKARSQSEPRQRPKSGRKQKSRRSASIDGKNDKENPWLIKLYGFDDFTNDMNFGSSGRALTKISNQKTSLIPFEPPESLYSLFWPSGEELVARTKNMRQNSRIK